MSAFSRNKSIRIVICFFFLGFVLLGTTSFFPEAAYAEKKSEYMLFGPYVTLSAGKYKVSFSLKVSSNRRKVPVATIDVVAEDARKLFTSRTLVANDFSSANRYESFHLYFETFGARDFEFRVKPLSDLAVSVDKVSITQLEKWSEQEATGGDLIRGSTGPETIVDADSLLDSSSFVEIKANDPIFGHNLGGLVYDSRASGGKAWEAEASNDNQASAVEIPGRGLKRWLIILIGFVAGFVFILMGIFTFQKR